VHSSSHSLRPYNAGGVDLAQGLKLRDPEGQRIAFRFGLRNPEAEAWLQQHSGTLVTRIVDDQLQNIRTALARDFPEATTRDGLLSTSSAG
jgi:hypothetical protein